MFIAHSTQIHVFLCRSYCSSRTGWEMWLGELYKTPLRGSPSLTNTRRWVCQKPRSCRQWVRGDFCQWVHFILTWLFTEEHSPKSRRLCSGLLLWSCDYLSRVFCPRYLRAVCMNVCKCASEHMYMWTHIGVQTYQCLYLNEVGRKQSCTEC